MSTLLAYVRINFLLTPCGQDLEDIVFVGLYPAVGDEVIGLA